MYVRSGYVVVALLLSLVLAGCSPVNPPGPVPSEIKTYDSTFTSGAPDYQKPDPFYRSFFRIPWAGKPDFRVAKKARAQKPYFIEFRARSAYSYGHASVVFGRLDPNGRIPVNGRGVLDPDLVEISGLHPATSDPRQWAKGHVVPVPAETGPSDGDFEDAYVTSRFRIDLTEQEFRKVVAIVNRHKKRYAYWYAPNYATNCLGYIGSIAKDMGLAVPSVPLLPRQFVQRLKAINT